MALVRWKWVDYLNIELYERNVTQRGTPRQQETQTGYDSDEDLYFERLNQNNLRRFLEADDLRQRLAIHRQNIIREQQRLIHQLYYNTYRTPHPPPAHVPIIR
jgi:hypothetical protein